MILRSFGAAPCGRAAALVLLLASLLSPAFAQSATPALPADRAAEVAADAAVRDWLAGRYAADLSVRGQDPLELAGRMLSFSSPPPEARVSYALRELVTAGENRRAYRYPVAARDGDAVLDVNLERSGGRWRATAVRLGSGEPAIPPWVSSPSGAWAFVAITAGLALASFTPTFWRRWLLDGLALARQHRRLVVWTNLALYGAFALGAAVGASSPRLVRFLQETVATVLGQGGIAGALDGGVVAAAFGFAYYNFSFGAFWTSFVPGALAAVLAYLVNFSRFAVLGVALGPGSVPLGLFVLHLPTIVIELQGYILVTAFAGILAARVIRGGLATIPVAFRDYLLCLPWALLFLVVAAWYEAWSLLWLAPRLFGS